MTASSLLVAHQGSAARAAFDAAARAWIDELSRLAFVLTDDHDAADDLVADALLAAWTQWSTVVASSNPKAYVRRIVVNQAASRIRRVVRSRSRLQLLGATLDDAVPAVDVSGSVDLRRALEVLPDGQRTCLLLRYGLDWSESEVAETLDISPGTVKSQTSRAARKLRSLLAPEEGR